MCLLNSIFGILNLLITLKINDCIEFMIHLIHRKQLHIPLLHNTVLILFDEGDGLVGVQLLCVWLFGEVSEMPKGLVNT